MEGPTNSVELLLNFLGYFAVIVQFWGVLCIVKSSAASQEILTSFFVERKSLNEISYMSY